MMTNGMEYIDDIEALLPWYAAGALDESEIAEVEAALAVRPELRASLALVEQDRDETISLNESLGAPGHNVWERVAAVAQAEPRKPPLLSRLAALIGAGPLPQKRRLVWAGAAAAVVIAVQAVAILSLLPSPQGPGPGYQSATAPVAEGASVLVAFAPETRLDQLGAFLRDYKAKIVEGPRAGGFYRLSVGDTKLSKDEVTALVAALSAAPIVKMALPGAGN